MLRAHDVAVAVEVGQLLGCEVHSGMSGSKFPEVYPKLTEKMRPWLGFCLLLLTRFG